MSQFNEKVRGVSKINNLYLRGRPKQTIKINDQQQPDKDNVSYWYIRSELIYPANYHILDQYLNSSLERTLENVVDNK